MIISHFDRVEHFFVWSGIVITGTLILNYTGALTKGDRRAATGADLTEFNFDTQYGRNALRTMYAHICRVCMFCFFREVLLLYPPQ